MRHIRQVYSSKHMTCQDNGNILICLHLSCSIKTGFDGSSKSIDPGQPVQSAQADLGLNFFLFANFLQI